MKENVDDDLEYHLEDAGENPLPTQKCSTKTKVLFTILIILFILLTGATAYFAYKYLDSRKSKKSDKENSNKEKIIPPDSETDDSKIIEVDSSDGFLYWETYGTKISNLSYVKENGIIHNSFKEGGENYNSEIGNINYGEDYIKSERNVYDLYIPYTATQRKEKNNKVILFIHGGGWMEGQKEYMDVLCKSYAKYGIITASIGYTLIKTNNTQTNMYRILDEITAAINSTGEYLSKEGFDTNKLEFAIGGHSAGGHLSLLYAYSINNIPYPIKFVVDLLGPVSIEPECFIQLKDNNEPLQNIEQKDIDEAIKSNKTKNKNEPVDIKSLRMINTFIGNQYNEDELNEILTNNESLLYKQFMNKIQYAFPTIYVNKKTLPTICLYSGKDEVIGIGHYAFIKKKFEENNNNNISLIYSKYTGHNDYAKIKTINGLKAMNKLNSEILNLFKK
jgi:acetyl esterase/lipase